MLSCHAIISELIIETASFCPLDSAAIIGLDRFDWLFLVRAALLGILRSVREAHQMNAAMPKAQRQKDLNISQLAGTYFHLADWQMISFPCGCSCFQISHPTAPAAAAGVDHVTYSLQRGC